MNESLHTVVMGDEMDDEEVYAECRECTMSRLADELTGGMCWDCWSLEL